MVYSIIKKVFKIKIFTTLLSILVCINSYAANYKELPNGKYTGSVVWDNPNLDGCPPGSIAFIFITNDYILIQAVGSSGGSPKSHKIPKNTSGDQVFDWLQGYKISFNFDIISRGRFKMNIFGQCNAEGIMINQDLPKINVEEVNTDKKDKTVDKTVKKGSEIDILKEEITQVELEILELKNLLTKLSIDEENLLDKKYIIIEQQENELALKKKTEDEQTDIQKI